MSLFQYLFNEGIIVADTSSVLKEVEDEWKNALGPDLDLTPSTPQGILIAAEASARVSVVDYVVQIANQLNPNYAGGIFLDSICALTGTIRRGPTATTVPDVELRGGAGVVVPIGSARSANGVVFITMNEVTLDGNGFAVADFIAETELGPVPCEVGKLVDAVAGRPIEGVISSYNPKPAVLGAKEQSDASLRHQRALTLAKNAMHTPEAIYGAILSIPGVKSVAMYDNNTGEDKVVDGIRIEKTSVWICVEGGDEYEVAKTIQLKKAPGTNTVGNRSVQVHLPNDTTWIRLSRPTITRVVCKVAYSQPVYTGTDVATVIRDSILDWANGIDTVAPALAIGTPLSAPEVIAAIKARVPTIVINSLTLNIGKTSTCGTFKPRIDELYSIQRSDIQVTDYASTTV